MSGNILMYVVVVWWEARVSVVVFDGRKLIYHSNVWWKASASVVFMDFLVNLCFLAQDWFVWVSGSVLVYL